MENLLWNILHIWGVFAYIIIRITIIIYPVFFQLDGLENNEDEDLEANELREVVVDKVEPDK